MVKRIGAMSLVVKPVDKRFLPLVPHLYNNPVRKPLRVCPSHKGTHTGGDIGASAYIVHAFTCASTSPCSMSAIAPRE